MASGRISPRPWEGSGEIWVNEASTATWAPAAKGETRSCFCISVAFSGQQDTPLCLFSPGPPERRPWLQQDALVSELLVAGVELTAAVCVRSQRVVAKAGWAQPKRQAKKPNQQERAAETIGRA